MILCLIAGMPTPAYGSSSYPVKEKSYVLVINSYVDGERWSGNLLNMISKFATPEEYTLRIDHISVMLVDTPEKLKEKQEVFFEANKKKPDGIIYLGVNGWAFMRDKIREKWGDIPTLVCSETGEMAENECYFNQRHSSDRVIPLQEAVKGYNATGLVIPYYVKGSIDLVKELIPGLKRLIFISDRRYVSTWLRDEMEKHMETSFPEGKVDFYTEGSCSMDSLLAVLSEKDPHRATAVMYYSWITEKPFLNHSLLYSTLYQGINGISRHPVFSLYDMGVEEGYTIDRIHELTKIDPWFLGKLKNIVDYKAKLSTYNKVEDIPADVMREAKILGFSDFQIARFVLNPTGNMEKENLAVRAHRKAMGILPAVKRINTIASEHPELTNYLYMTYAVEGYDVNYYKNEKSVVVLGSGAYRIGSSVEFDWCSVNAVQTARKLGYKSIMINYNPETVSTDYDMCDRLYFDELSFERVLDVIDLEQPRGVIVSVGGQIPNNLAMKLYRQSVPVLGTSPISIDRAENRNKFSAMLDQLGIDQPAWQELTSLEDVKGFVEKVGYPVLVRPSYVLSGAAMNVCYDDEELENFLKMAAEVSKEYPVVVSQFLENTKEIEFDAVAQNGEVVEYAISEHVEFAGVHSGDATLVFPAQKIYFATARRIKKISRQIAKELNISGPFNIQFLARNNEVKVIECNLRASRSFPFVSKVLKRNFIETATRIMLDAPYSRPDKSAFDIDWIGVKASQFSFSRLHKADPVLGVDMSSTGEVGCIGDDFSEALLNSMIATGFKIPEKAVMFSSGAMKSKVDLLDASRMLFAKGYQIYATAGTAAFLNAHGVDTTPVYWPDEKPGAENNVMKMIADHKFDLIVNIPKNHSKRELTNGYRIRRGAIDHNIPLITNARLASAFIEAFCELKLSDIQIKSWQEYK